MPERRRTWTSEPESEADAESEWWSPDITPPLACDDPAHGTLRSRRHGCDEGRPSWWRRRRRRGPERERFVSFVYPSILRRTIALPSDQKLEAAAVQTTVQDLFHLVRLLSFH